MRAVVFAVMLVACGKSDSATPAPTKDNKPAMEGHEHHEGMPPALDKFHNLLAPHWHAQKGEQRMKDTCAAIGDFKSAADDVAKAKPDAAWTTSAKSLADAVTGLESTCKANDAAAFEPAFQKVHEGFHAMLEAGGESK